MYVDSDLREGETTMKRNDIIVALNSIKILSNLNANQKGKKIKKEKIEKKNISFTSIKATVVQNIQTKQDFVILNFHWDAIPFPQFQNLINKNENFIITSIVLNAISKNETISFVKSISEPPQDFGNLEKIY
jgi:hypothetical protein